MVHDDVDFTPRGQVVKILSPELLDFGEEEMDFKNCVWRVLVPW
jgi:hypothetical protein